MRAVPHKSEGVELEMDIVKYRQLARLAITPRKQKSLLFRRRTKIQRRKFYHRHFDLDLAEVDVQRLVEQAGYRDRERNHEQDHDRLQPDPGQGAPINIRALDLLGRNAAQIEQGEPERRMQERCLHVDAQHDAEPDQRSIRADYRCQDFLRDRSDHRQDDERDLEEVEEERQEEDEEIDEDQEAPDAAGKRRQHMLQPYAAGDAQEHHRKTGRADQDEHHHAGDAHRRLIALLDQIAQFGNADGLETNPDNGDVGDGESQLEVEVFAIEHRNDRSDARRNDAGDQHLAPRGAEVLAVDRRQHDRAARAPG